MIYYLSKNTLHHIDGDGVADVNADATSLNLESAIKSWAWDVRQLVIFLVGHGGFEKFKIGETEEVSAQILDSWLDTAQNNGILQGFEFPKSL